MSSVLRVAPDGPISQPAAPYTLDQEAILATPNSVKCTRAHPGRIENRYFREHYTYTP